MTRFTSFARSTSSADPLFCLFAVVGLAAFVLPTSVSAQTNATTVKDGSNNVVLQSNVDGGLYVPGTFNTGTIPAEGSGTRLMWHPAKAAFRAGGVGVIKDGTQWDASMVGKYSVAFGRDTEASGFGAVATGDRSTASNNAAVAMGDQTTASGNDAVAIGSGTTAGDRQTTAMGDGTTASARAATAMGSGTTASGRFATAMGFVTTASGNQATAMGDRTTAATDQSLSVGECNDNNTSSDNTLFVAGNGTFSNGSCSRSDALVLDESGNLSIDGVFESGPTNSLFAGHFQGTASGDAFNDPSKQVVLIENTSGNTSANVLALQGGPNSDPGTAVNLISFYDGDGGSIGAIQGNGSGGTEFKTSGSDYAEELPVASGRSVPEPTDLVGVRGGEISLETDGADRLMVVSSAPAVTGNTTPSTAADDDRRVAVAFVGQVPAQVRGTAEVGDLIVASGRDDGTARAMAPSDYRRAEHGPIAGQAWSAKSSEGIGEVTVAVGLGQSGVVAGHLQEQEDEIAALKAENEKIKERLATLEATVSADEPAVASLAGPWSLAVVLALGLGGLLGVRLWRQGA